MKKKKKKKRNGRKTLHSNYILEFEKREREKKMIMMMSGEVIKVEYYLDVTTKRTTEMTREGGR